MSDHNLIANHQILPADESLTRMWPGDSEQLAMSRAYHSIEVKKHMSNVLNLDVISFCEPGKVEIELMVNGELKPFEFKIKSISDEMVRRLAEPITRFNSKWPTKWDSESKTRVHDESHPDYDEVAHQFLELSREYEFRMLLHGLDMVIEHQGRVLWDPKDKSQQDFKASVARLNEIGIRRSDIQTLVSAINAISNKKAEETRKEFEKK